MNNLSNVQNLDSIIFFTGEYSTVAAKTLENRDYGTSVEGHGKLMKDNNSYSYYTNFPSIKYVERNVNFENMNDLYSETLSYVSKTNFDFSVGYTYIVKNRYNAIYTYETDLDNDFDNAKIFVPRDLNNFLLGLNNQKYNKQLKYKDDIEVSSIKIDQTYYRWYPEDTIAYYNTIEHEIPITYTYYTMNDNSTNAFDDWDSVEMTDELSEMKAYAEANNLYLHQFTYSYTEIEIEKEPYKIGGNFYSYIRKSYDIINTALIDKIGYNLSKFEDKYNNDPSIYAYYMYDCNSDIEMLLTTQSLGIKQSTFKIGFDSKYNNWFGNTINIKADLSNGDEIAKITSFKNDEVFSIFKNKQDRLSGENKIINKDETKTFVAELESSIENEDIINILTPYSIDTLDLSPIKTKISPIFNINESDWILRDCNLKSLILDDGDNTTKSNIEKIFGLNDITTLEYINMANVDKLRATPAIDKLENLKVFNASNSNIDSFRPARGAELYHVDLPQTVKSIKLVDNLFNPGKLTIAGEEVEFDGKLNYTPNSLLGNLTLRNINDKLSYNLVTEWYNVLDSENKFDSLIYLEMKNINWTNVPAQTLINLKKFDINPNLSGEVSIIGSGNYKWLTRSEYQNITKLYGVNSFVKGNTISNKIFKDLDINVNNKETFEFILKVTNENVTTKNNNITIDDVTSTRYNDTLNVEFKGYFYDRLDNTETVTSPYNNRAANSVLDMIYSGEITEFNFVKDPIDKYVYCQLPRSIDTSNSNEVKTINAGDILLFNGDTLVIFFENTTNTMYEYIKLGSIVDSTVQDYMGRLVSSIGHWFDGDDESYKLTFIPSQRPVVIQDLLIDFENWNENNIIYNTDVEPFKLKVNIDEYTKENIDSVENKKINIEYDSNILTIEELEPTDEFKLYSVKAKEGHNFNEIVETTISIYCDANRVDTEKVINVSLRKEFEYSQYDEETNNILLNSSMYEYNDESENIIIDTSLVNVHYDEETQILTID